MPSNATVLYLGMAAMLSLCLLPWVVDRLYRMVEV